METTAAKYKPKPTVILVYTTGSILNRWENAIKDLVSKSETWKSSWV